jgi:hypothetical protein
MATRYGMTDALGSQVYGEANHEVLVGRDYGATPDYSDATAERIDSEVAAIMAKAHDVAYVVLDERREQIEKMAEILMERETVDGEALEALLNNTWDDYIEHEEEILANKAEALRVQEAEDERRRLEEEEKRKAEEEQPRTELQKLHAQRNEMGDRPGFAPLPGDQQGNGQGSAYTLEDVLKGRASFEDLLNATNPKAQQPGAAKGDAPVEASIARPPENGDVATPDTTATTDTTDASNTPDASDDKGTR